MRARRSLLCRRSGSQIVSFPDSSRVSGFMFLRTLSATIGHGVASSGRMAIMGPAGLYSIRPPAAASSVTPQQGRTRTSQEPSVIEYDAIPPMAPTDLYVSRNCARWILGLYIRQTGWAAFALAIEVSREVVSIFWIIAVVGCKLEKRCCTSRLSQPSQPSRWRRWQTRRIRQNTSSRCTCLPFTQKKDNMDLQGQRRFILTDRLRCQRRKTLCREPAGKPSAPRMDGIRRTRLGRLHGD